MICAGLIVLSLRKDLIMMSSSSIRRTILIITSIFAILCMAFFPVFSSNVCYGAEKTYVKDVVFRDTGNGYNEPEFGFDGTDGTKTYTIKIPDNSLAIKMKITASSFEDDDVYYSLNWGSGYSDPQRIQSDETITTERLDELYGSSFRLGDCKECKLCVGKYNSENNVWDEQTEYRFTFIRQVVLNSITAYDGDEKRTITPGYVEPGIDAYYIVLPKEQDVITLKPSLQIKDSVRETDDEELKTFTKLIRYDLPEEAVSKTDDVDEILVSALPEKEGIKYIPFTVYYNNENAVVESSEYCFILDTASYVYPVNHEIKSAVIEGDDTRACNKGDSVELKVITDVEENAELTYQWYRDSYLEGRVTSSMISGANSDTYIPKTDYSRCDDYYCTVVNSAGGETHSKTTNKVHMTVNLSFLSVPSFTAEAEDQNVNLGDSISLTCRGQCRDIDVDNNNRLITCTYKWFVSKFADCSDAMEITEDSLFPYGDNHSRIDFLGDKPGYTYYYCVCACSCNGWTESARSRIITVFIKDTSAGIENLEGSGEQNDPFIIKDIEDIQLVSTLVRGGYSFKNSYLLLEKDISLPYDWIPIGALKEGEEDSEKGINIFPFSGNLDGDGHTVTIANGGKPLFGYVREASIKNLNISGEKVNGYGLIDNYVVDYGNDGNSETGVPATCNIENVTILSGSSLLKSGFIGGYASGSNIVSITNCAIQSGVTIGYDKSESNIGSFAGEFNGTITNSTSAADVYGKDDIGGLVGRKGQSMGPFEITNSSFTGTINATGSRVGGIAGSGYYSSNQSAPNVPVALINNCYAACDITGADNVGGILGSEPEVETAWGNGTGGVQNSFYYGNITATGSNVGGIIGYYNSLDQYQTIANNYFLDTCGLTKGIGKLKKVITAAEDGQYGMEDDFDAERACSATSAESFADGTVLAKLNSGEGSYQNWRQDEKYPVFGEEAVPVELSVSRYIEEYLIGDTFDTFGMEITVRYSDGSVKNVDPSEVQFSGFDSKTVGQKTITATYGPLSTTFEVRVIYDNPPEILVKLIIIGDTVHGSASEVHTLKGGGLKKWLDKGFVINMNMSVYDLLVKGLDELGLKHKASYSAQYETNYVSGVQVPGSDDYLEEFTNGALSGWMYHVNGYYPDVGVSRYYPDDGDVIVFHYTDDYTQEEGIGTDGAGYGEGLDFYPPKDDPETLAEAKTDAKAELAEYLESKDLTLYRDEQKAELVQAVEQGDAAIDAAQTVDDVTAALADAKAALDAVKTDTQMAEEEKALVKAKKDALADLYLYKVPADYREVEATMLSSILAEGEASINAAKTKEEVEALLAVYKARIDELKTDAEYTREEEEARKEQEKQKRKAKSAAIKKAKARKTRIKVKALKKHRAKVIWKKVSGVTGYKVYRATNKTGKYKLIKTIKKAGTLKYTNKKLKKGKKYFYKLRTYTVIDGKAYLGKWSAVKKVKAK